MCIRDRANTVDGLYESLRPDIFKMDFEPAYKDAILYLKGIIDGKIRLEKMCIRDSCYPVVL